MIATDPSETKAPASENRAVLRFAPSPNGYLHRGHAYSALLNAEFARRLHGRLLLRIEDIDPQRSLPRYCSALEEDLAWLGLTFEQPVRRQSEHFADYRESFARLHDLGVVYRCFCSRGEIGAAVKRMSAGGITSPLDPDGTPVYPGTCRTLKKSDIENCLAEGKPFQWRLDHQKAMKQTGPVSWSQFDIETGRTTASPVQLDRWGDVVLVRKDILTTYHLSVVVDDSIQGITHIVRGQDLEAATDIHATLQSLLLLKPPLYIHHPLLRDDAGEKLSKSRLSRSLRDERSEGLTLARLKRELGFSESRE